MNDFDRDIQNKALSFEWGSAVAGKVLVKRHERKKRNRIILLAAMPLVLLGAGLFYQLNQVVTLRNTINSAIEETFPEYNGDHIISQEVDDKIMQYCMND